MSRKVLFLGGVVFALFLGGVIQLFLLRFSTGDVYPYYSSLRSDPLGTKAFFEAMKSIQLKVERNYETFSKLKDRTSAAVFFTGLETTDLYDVPADLAADLNYFVRNGGRLILTFLPQHEEAPVTEELQKKIEMMQENVVHTVDLTQQWDVQMKIDPLPKGQSVFVQLAEDLPLPKNLSLHTSAYFLKPGKAWRVLYGLSERPVMIERNLGKGTILLAADSYFLSNEAMIRERNAPLLSWMIGLKQEVIFDEYHFGVMSAPGVVSLARKYKLEWVGFGLLMIFLLYMWKSAVSLAPPHPEAMANSRATGKESAAGLANLLRRNLPVSQILKVSYEQWKKTSTVKSAKTRVKIEALLDSKDPVNAYNEISRLVKERLN